jgi:hypothetical protein
LVPKVSQNSWRGSPVIVTAPVFVGEGSVMLLATVIAPAVHENAVDPLFPLTMLSEIVSEVPALLTVLAVAEFSMITLRSMRTAPAAQRTVLVPLLPMILHCDSEDDPENNATFEEQMFSERKRAAIVVVPENDRIGDAAAVFLLTMTSDSASEAPEKNNAEATWFTLRSTKMCEATKLFMKKVNAPQE